MASRSSRWQPPPGPVDSDQALLRSRFAGDAYFRHTARVDRSLQADDSGTVSNFEARRPNQTSLSQIFGAVGGARAGGGGSGAWREVSRSTSPTVRRGFRTEA